MLSQCVCPSHAGIVSTWINIPLDFSHHSTHSLTHCCAWPAEGRSVLHIERSWPAIQAAPTDRPTILHCYKKVSPLMSDNNFGKCESIFKIISSRVSQESSLCIHRKYFHLTCNMLLHYLVKFENPTMLLILTASSTNCWQVPGGTWGLNI